MIETTVPLTTRTPFDEDALDTLKRYIIKDGMTAEEIVHVLLYQIARMPEYAHTALSRSDIEIGCLACVDNRHEGMTDAGEWRRLLRGGDAAPLTTPGLTDAAFPTNDEILAAYNASAVSAHLFLTLAGERHGAIVYDDARATYVYRADYDVDKDEIVATYDDLAWMFPHVDWSMPTYDDCVWAAGRISFPF